MTLDRLLDDLERCRADLGARPQDIDVVVSVDPSQQLLVAEDGWFDGWVFDVCQVRGAGLQIVIGAA